MALRPSFPSLFPIVFTLVLAASTTARAGEILASSARAYRSDGRETTEDVYGGGFALADLDGDGDLDIVRSGMSSDGPPAPQPNFFYVLENLGQREFAAPVAYPTPGGPTADVAIADVDGDGDPDVALVQSDNGFSGNKVLVFRNLGDGTFGPQQTWTVAGTTMPFIDAADVDLDGDPDIGVHTKNGAEFTLLINSGAGSFSKQVYQGGGKGPIHFGDLNGDGYPEALHGTEGGVRVRMNLGNGAFSPSTTFYGGGNTTSSPPEFDLGDLDADGDLDLVFGEAGIAPPNPPGGFSVFLNDGQGGLSAAQKFETIWEFDHNAGRLADLDGDGSLDWVTSGDHNSYPVWLFVPGRGDGTFDPKKRKMFAAPELPELCEVADVDGDGFEDVLVGGRFTRTIRVHYSEGGQFSLPPVFDGTDWMRRVAVGDLDLDGDLDVVAVYSLEIVSFINIFNGWFFPKTQSFVGSCWEAIELADLDGDQYLDLLLLKDTSCPPYNLYTMKGNGDGTFSNLTGWYMPSPGRNEMVVFDWDNDGDNDVVVSEGLGCPSCPPNVLYFFANKGNGTFEPVVSKQHPLFPGLTLAAGDVNEDGITDFVGSTGDGVAVHIGNGDGTFQLPKYYGTHALRSVRLADLNGDGHLDVCFQGAAYFSQISGSANTVGVLLGAGDGTFTQTDWEIGTTSQYQEQHGLAVGDFDGDGQPDLAVASGSGSDLVVYTGNGDGTIDPMRRYGVDGDVWYPASGDFDADGVDDLVVPMRKGFPWLAYGFMSYVRGIQKEPGTWADLGFALAGTHGDPQLTGTGDLFAGSPWSLTLANALESAQAWLLVGFSKANTPFLGGTLVPSPDLVVPFPTDATGGAVLAGTWPYGVPSKLRIYLQWWITDPAGPFGMAASNALVLRTP